MEERVRRIEADVKQLKALVIPKKHSMVRARGYLSLLKSHLSESEARELTFMVGLDWDSLSGENKSEKIISIVSELERSGRLYQFEELVREIRPNIDWPPFV